MLTPRLTDIDVLRERLARAGVKPRKQAGQHFLISEEVIEATVATLLQWKKRAWRVTELGAGAGTLTQALAAAGAEVRAIEWDRKLAKLLPDHVPKKARRRVKVLEGDLRQVDWTWPEAYLVAGNIPYNVSGLVLRRLTQLTPAPEAAVFLIQQEVAERVVAVPPQMSLVGLAVQLWGGGTILLRVPPSCFWPAPQVHSALILITPHENIQMTLQEREQVLGLARIFFQAKRKQMGSVARRRLGLSETETTQRFSQAGVGMQQRPQELSPETWRKLAAALGSQMREGVS